MQGWLTIEEAAKRVGKSTDTIYRWIRAGKLQKYEMAQGASVIEARLLEVDREQRQRRGRPRALRGAYTHVSEETR